MLTDQSWLCELTPFDLEVFDAFVRKDHPLAVALERIDWAAFEAPLAEYYSADRGQPAYTPLIMFKLEYLRYHYHLSDRQVMEHGGTDIGFRYLLQVGKKFRMPHPTSLCHFRGRLGAEGFHRLFQQVQTQARQAGLVQDRLRLKDASHVLANIATPSSLQLLAQIRDRLLEAAEPFDAEGGVGHRIEVELLRERTRSLDAALRLATRITHLQEILEWALGLETPADASGNPAWKWLQKTCSLTQRILGEQRDPTAQHRLISLVDQEACRGKHGGWYDGYMIDILMDADSELITEVNVLQAGGNEALDALELVRREEQQHGNDIQALSMDGAGFHGEMLHAFEDPSQQLNVEVIVPPQPESATKSFSAAKFQTAADRSHVTCPAGQDSRYRQRNERASGYIYRFTRRQCDKCPLVEQCMARPRQGKFGKTVRKNDHEAEYQRARQRAETTRYAEVRKEHPAVERKLNEVMNHHYGRWARYWGQQKVLAQQYMTCLVVNVKRMMKLLQATPEVRHALQ
jgi:transposase